MKARNLIRKVASVFTRHHDEKPAEPVTRTAPREERHARPAQRQTDIPMDVLANAYSPTQTSVKASFRTDGSDRHRDQEYGRGPEDDRWRDEDRITNRSGDPRIGTHGRSYEPGEDRNRAR